MAEVPGTLRDPFAFLGVPTDAGEGAIREAYRRALREHPPERDPEGFKQVRAAYEALRDPAERLRSAVVRRLWTGSWSPPTAEELGGTPPGPPSPAELIADLRRIALAGTDLERTAFPEDMRVPPAPDWAHG